MRRVLITGSRNIKDLTPIRKVFLEIKEKYGSVLIIEGGQKSWDPQARRYYGVDYFAGELAKELGFELDVYPADWNAHGRGAGPIRNEEMVAEGKPDEAHAFHEDPNLGRGTADCIRRVKLAAIPHEIHLIPVGNFL